MDVQAVLRFLTTTAKLPLATAIQKIKGLQEAKITKVEDIAGSNVETLLPIFGDEKTAKQILNAAKRSSKKRDAPSSAAPPAKKRVKVMPGEVLSPADMEASLALPDPEEDEETLAKTVLITNRAPLVLAFAVTLLDFTMPNQPISSKLSLAQAVVSVNSRSKAVSLGIESGKSAEEEGYGEGQPKVRIMGRDIRTMRRWGYDPTSTGEDSNTQPTQSTATVEGDDADEENETIKEKEPPLWGIDLEAMRKSATQPVPGSSTNLPIYTSQSARSYLLKSFDSKPNPDDAVKKESSPKKQKKSSAAAIVAQREENLGRLLGALKLLFESWSGTLDATELDKRAWTWYTLVRPEVVPGPEGWGGKGEVPLESILKLRRET